MINNFSKRIFLVVAFLSFTLGIFAQANGSGDSAARYKVAVFMPLYLEQAYDAGGNYLLQNNAFPSQSIVGVEFYQGVKLALDSLNQLGKRLEVFIFDSEANKSVSQHLNDDKYQDLSLIITHCAVVKLREYADEGLRRNIPVVNVNLPNNGGIRNNPFFVMLNSTLDTQVKSIYQYLQKYYATKKIVVFRRNGQMEDMIKTYLEDAAKTTVSVPLKLTYVNLSENFTSDQLKAALDTIGGTMAVVGSLNDAFGRKVTTQLAELSKKYTINVMGMPTWDGNKTYANKEFHNMEILYCTPFYNSRTDKVSEQIIKYFEENMYSRPSDMVMRGYEAIWRFGNLLTKYGKDFPSNINTREFNLFRDYDIMPVKNNENQTIDYFENKKLYFVKWKAGTLVAAN